MRWASVVARIGSDRIGSDRIESNRGDRRLQKTSIGRGYDSVRGRARSWVRPWVGTCWRRGADPPDGVCVVEGQQTIVLRSSQPRKKLQKTVRFQGGTGGKH